MGKVIRFPVERRRPHIALAWDHTWDEYLIGVMGQGDRALNDSLEWCDDYSEATNRLISMGERFGLPLVDLTAGGRRK